MSRSEGDALLALLSSHDGSTARSAVEFLGNFTAEGVCHPHTAATVDGFTEESDVGGDRGAYAMLGADKVAWNVQPSTEGGPAKKPRPLF